MNSKPHVGFALELIQADVIARYLRLIGFDVFFLTGTDENSIKNVRAAQELKVSTKELCESNSEAFRKLIPSLHISSDDFIRTSTDPRHRPAAQKLWATSADDDIYKQHYEGSYCVGCEAFYSTEECPDSICPEHGTQLEVVSEDNYFFRLSRYQKLILKMIDDGALQIIPESRRSEMLSFVKTGLHDFSISRDKKRSDGWGISVPNDTEQVMYVWYDALTNYISALGYSNDGDLFRKYWIEADRRIHVVGKGINRFHTVYWPAMLLSASLPLPQTVFVHGYLTANGQKISKSLGNVIDPINQAKKYGIDTFRYYLLRAVSSYEDGDYSEERLKELHNSNLANNLGNLVSRIRAMGEGIQYITPCEERMDAPDEFHKAMNSFRFNNALAILWSMCDDMNALFEIKKPWLLLKEGKTEEIRQFLDVIIQKLRVFSFWVEPFLPTTSKRINELILPGQRVVRTSPLFPRVK